MPFRSDINGLRAIAVLMVVCFHFFPDFVPGGFIGVDVFFVISGFLMTKIIINQSTSSDFVYIQSLKSFYYSRIKRIIPALSWTCLALLAWGYWQFNSALLNEVSKHVLSSLLFISNITYLFETGYFDTAAQNKWLLHSWSLSVEWQFYLLYPMVLFAMVKVCKLAWVKRLILLAALVSFALNLYLSGYFSAQPNPTLVNANYYLLPSRAWEMLLGGLGFCYGTFGIKLSLTAKKTISYTALLFLFASCYLVSDHRVWPGLWALLPTMCTYLLIVCHLEQQPLLNNKPMQVIGLWSYSIYLWHWPIMVAGLYYQLSFWWLLGPLISILLGWLSFTTIEKPNRTRLNITVFITVLALSSWPLYNKWQQSSKTQVAHLSYSSSICQGFEQYCTAYGQNSYGENSAAPNSESKVDFILWGDSHSQSLARALALEGYNLAVFTTLGCPPINNIRRLDGMGGDSGCNTKINDRIYQHLISERVQKHTNHLMLIGRWSVYHWGWRKNGKLQQANHYLCYKDCTSLANQNVFYESAQAQSLANWKLGFEQTIKSLSQHYQLSVFKGGPSLKVRGIDYHDAPWQQLSLDEHLAYQQATDTVIESWSLRYGFNTIEHGKLWFKDGKMQMYHNQQLLFNDDNHPTLKAWQVIMEPLTNQLPKFREHHDERF